MTVLGLGKMGTNAMAPQSDLDLVFIFADNVDTELATKIVQRLRTTLTVKLREGIAYELDMRLRPSGRSGPPAVKLSAFREHHMKRAHSWEHIALAPARIVAGSKTLGEAVMQIKSEILARPRDILAFKADAFAMYQRLSDERLEDTPPDMWRTKLRAGGLLTADYLRSCHVVSDQKPDIELRRAIEDWNALQMWERLLGLTGKTLAQTPDRFADIIDIATLAERQSKLEKTVGEAVKAFFKDVDGTPLQEPRPIMWKS
jgi:glutamate-ammonia-ligase adenylyltransferase